MVMCLKKTSEARTQIFTESTFLTSFLKISDCEEKGFQLYIEADGTGNAPRTCSRFVNIGCCGILTVFTESSLLTSFLKILDFF